MTVRLTSVLVAIFLALASCTSAARAGVRAVAEGGGAGPALLDGRVLWGSGGQVFSAPALGGPAAVLGGGLSLAGGAELVTGSGQVAVRSGSALSAFGASGFARVAPAFGAPPLFRVVPSVQPSAAGLVTMEDDGVWLRRGGRREEVALPPGADPSHVAVAGALGVAPVPEGAMIVFSVVDGTEGRQISLGPYDGFNVSGLSMSAGGDVAATVPVGDGTDALVFSPAGSERVRVLARGVRFGRVAVGASGVAFVSGDGLREGVRVVVVGFDGREVFRGPPTVDVGSMVLDGGVVGWSTPSCRFVGWSSRYTIPAGPCLRSEVALARVAGGTRVACINAATRRCHVRAAGRVWLVPRRSARVVPVSGPLRVVDVDGRERVVRP